MVPRCTRYWRLRFKTETGYPEVPVEFKYSSGKKRTEIVPTNQYLRRR